MFKVLHIQELNKYLNMDSCNQEAPNQILVSLIILVKTTGLSRYSKAEKKIQQQQKTTLRDLGVTQS